MNSVGCYFGVGIIDYVGECLLFVCSVPLGKQ